MQFLVSRLLLICRWPPSPGALTRPFLRAERQTAFPLLKRHRFPGGSDGKEPSCHVRDPGSIPGSGRSPGEGNGYPLQYFCLENPMDGGAQ